MSKFDSYVKYHRKLLEKGIVEHPKYFKKSDLLEYDKAVLLEALSSELPKDISAAMQSQVNAIKELRKFYDGLTVTDKSKIDNNSVADQIASKKNFGAELEDLEDEINGIYGKLGKGGFFSQAAKRGFGFFQRGMGKLFGAGGVTNTSLEEQKMFETLFPEYSNLIEQKMYQDLFAEAAETKELDKDNPKLMKEYLSWTTYTTAPSLIIEELQPINEAVDNIETARQIYDYLANNQSTLRGGGFIVPRKVIDVAAKNYGITPSEVADIAHGGSLLNRGSGLNVEGSLATNVSGETWLNRLVSGGGGGGPYTPGPNISGGGGGGGGGGPPLTTPSPRPGPGDDGVSEIELTPKQITDGGGGGGSPIPKGGGGIISAITGGGLATKAAIGAGIAALVAAGAAGWKMRNRRKRIENLLRLAKPLSSELKAVVVTADPTVEEITPEDLRKSPPPGGTGTEGEPTPPASEPVTSPLPVRRPGGPVGDGKKDIYVMRGKDGKGFQSRAARAINANPALKAKAGEHQKAASTVINALAKDLRATNMFNVLEEGRTQINLPTTLAALNKVRDPKVKEILRNEIVNLLRQNGVMVRSDILKNPGITTVEVEVKIERPVTEPGTDPVTGREKSADEILKKELKSMLSFPANKPKSFSKADWEKLFSANAKNFGGDTEEARAGRDVIRKYHKMPSFTTSITFTPDMATENEPYKELVALKNYGSVMESLRRKYRLGLITLHEYNIRKAKLEKMLLKEHIKTVILNNK